MVHTISRRAAISLVMLASACITKPSSAQSLLDTLRSIGEAASNLNREAVLSSDMVLMGGPFAKAAGPLFDGDWIGTFQCSSAIGGGAAFSRPIVATVRNGDMKIEFGREGTVSHFRLEGRLTTASEALLRGVVYDSSVSALLDAELRGSTTNKHYEAHGRLSGRDLGQVRSCVVALSVTTFAEAEEIKRQKIEETRLAQEEQERKRAAAEKANKEIAEAAERDRKAKEDAERAVLVERERAEQERIRAALSEEQKRREKAEAAARKLEEARKIDEERIKNVAEEERKRREMAEAATRKLEEARKLDEERAKNVVEEERKRRELAEADARFAKLEHQKVLAQTRQNSDNSAVEMAFWDSIKTSSNPEDYKAYLETFPSGRFAALARVRSVQQPTTPQAAPAKPDPVSSYYSEMRQEARHALLVGNSNYQTLPKLKNPSNDVKAMAQSLTRLNFKVTVHENLRMEKMADALDEFGAQIRSGGVALFYYAGHGVQVRGANYLMPIEANPKSEIDIRARSIDSTIVMEHFAEARTRVNLMILDACRDNPLTVAGRSLTRGLAVAGKAPPGTLIAYSTSPDHVSLDGKGENSVFTAELMRQLESPGLTAEEVFKRVSLGVRKITNGSQVPWTTGSLDGDFYFRLPPK